MQVIHKRNAGSDQTAEDKKRVGQAPRIRAAFSLQSLNAEDRTIDLTFGSETPTRMWTWDYGAIMETLSFAEGNVRMDRLNNGAPLLDNHNDYGSVGDVVIGVVEKAWVEGKKGFATVRFAKGGNAEDIFQKVRDGIIRNVSVGYMVHKYKVDRSLEKGQLDQYRAVDWEPYEVSLVAIPADYSAQVRSFDPQNLIVEDSDETLARKTEAEKEKTLNLRSAQVRVLLAQYPNKNAL